MRASLSAGIVGIVTWVDFSLPHLNSTTVALTLLLAVLAIATRWGLFESLTASLAGMICLNYFFLPPVGRLTIAEPQNWVALVAFVVTAAVASQLSANAKRRAAEAASRQHEMERLYALSRSLMLMDAKSSFAKQIAAHIAGQFGFSAVALYDCVEDEMYCAGAFSVSVDKPGLKRMTHAGAPPVETSEGATLIAVRVGERAVGSLAVQGSEVSGTGLRAIAQLVAIALERARNQEAASRVAAAQQSEELKSATLDALAHEFKTPLTVVKAAVSSLRDDPAALGVNRELIEIADEETDRLTEMVTEAIQVARIEAGRIELRKSAVDLEDLVRHSVAMLAGKLKSRSLTIHALADLPPVYADAELIRMVIRQLIDNATKYSPQDTPIAIRLERRKETLVVAVADSGPGIPETERISVFEKFYRGRAVREQIPGTGMGLAIAKEVVCAHGGEIRVEGRAGGGSEFIFCLPVATQEPQ